jgi:hypothetical protein
VANRGNPIRTGLSPFGGCRRFVVIVDLSRTDTDG